MARVADADLIGWPDEGPFTREILGTSTVQRQVEVWVMMTPILCAPLWPTLNASESFCARHHLPVWQYLARLGGRECADELAGDVLRRRLRPANALRRLQGHGASVALWHRHEPFSHPCADKRPARHCVLQDGGRAD